jgi:plasmid stabilization system protein ParE
VADFDKFRVYYLVRAEAVEIVRVLHGARELGGLLDE